MHITILKIEKDNYVLFESKYGIGRGKWTAVLPKEQEVIFVELEINNKYDYGQNLHDSKSGVLELGYSGETMFLCGLLESVDEDGYALLRIGDEIIPFEIKGKCPSLIGRYIKLETNALLLYPVEY